MGSKAGRDQRDGRRQTPRATRPPDQSMSLLARIAADALDPDYRRVTERRRAASAAGESSTAEASMDAEAVTDPETGTDPETDTDSEAGTKPRRPRRPRWAGSVALGVGLLVIGLMASVAAERVQANESVVSAERESLIERIQDADADIENLYDQVGSLEADIRALETAQLDNSTTGAELSEQTSALQALVGTRRVAGPGITVTLDNAPEDWPGRDVEESDVLDVDIQQVINGLWGAGAEAIAVNGQRVTPATAIRSANDIIQVNYRPLSPPYHVSAVGDDGELAARFDQGVGGQWLRSAKRESGIQYSIAIAEDDLVLPSGSAPLINAVPEEPS